MYDSVEGMYDKLFEILYTYKGIINKVLKSILKLLLLYPFIQT
jgi:hypothetical protein